MNNFLLFWCLNQTIPYYKFALALHPIQISYQIKRSYDLSILMRTHTSDVNTTNEPRQQSRRRHYTTRVRESLTSRFAMCICSVFLSLLLVVGVIMFVLWLSLRPHRPRFYLSAFSAPGLAQSTSPVNSAFTLNITSRNPNAKIGISKLPF